MRKRIIATMAATMLLAMTTTESKACTGITLRAADGACIPARTIEWGGSDLKSRYVVVPRGYTQTSYAPGGEKRGMEFTAKYGYIGLAVEQEEFVAEGLNEAGLSAGLFYFPRYGAYEAFSEPDRSTSIADLQLVAWVLGSCKTVDEVKAAVAGVHVVAIDPRASTVHWRFTDATGQQAILEITDGKARFFDSRLGVLTNSPSYEWQLTNLNNYVNLLPGTAPQNQLGELSLTSFGAGSGFLGLPGDVTPPSRFVRAAFYQASTPRAATATEAVRQCFQILNNFDIPIGIETEKGQQHADLPSATQWTSATDMANGRIYYRTMRNSAIRCIDLKAIDFGKVRYLTAPLDEADEQPIVMVKLKNK